jgi:hypothetical protein
MKSAITPLIAALVLGAPAALADVYRSTMPDGTIVYADLPQPGAREVRKIRPGPARTGTIIVTPEDETRVRMPPPPRAAPGVSVMPTPAREPVPELVQGRQTPRQLPRPAH